MNRAFRIAVVLMTAASLAGCVSSGKFNKLKAEQAVLETEKSALEKQTAELTQANNQLKSDIDRLNAQSASLTAELRGGRVLHDGFWFVAVAVETPSAVLRAAPQDGWGD